MLYHAISQILMKYNLTSYSASLKNNLYTILKSLISNKFLGKNNKIHVINIELIVLYQFI